MQTVIPSVIKSYIHFPIPPHSSGLLEDAAFTHFLEGPFLSAIYFTELTCRRVPIGGSCLAATQPHAARMFADRLEAEHALQS